MSTLAEKSSENSPTSDLDSPSQPSPPPPPKRGVRFWLAMLAIMLSTFLSALDLLSVATALPTIVAALHGTQFVWIGSAYGLATVAAIPIAGNVSKIFGRRSVLLASLLFFALGSALCGGAQSMTMLIAGRTAQGCGSGGILVMTEIILADLVPLNERGTYQGMIGLVWSLAACIGPPVGGAFASRKDFTWRGLFYLNLPLTGIAAAFCLFCLNLKVPEGSLIQKLRRIDWIGNLIIIAASSSALLGLTWGGVQFSWTSVQVLVPLILGLCGMVLWVIYEIRVAAQPILSSRFFSNRTTVSGYVMTGIHGLLVAASVFYLPVYFQACKDASPIRSGVDVFPYSFSVPPLAIIAGALASALKKYHFLNIIAWCLIVIGIGLHTILRVNSNTGTWVIVQIVAGAGFGILYTATTFAILSPLPVIDNVGALSLFIFIRAFFQSLGITIGATVLQNELKTRLPKAFLDTLPSGISVVYASIPQIPSISDSGVKAAVQKAFADSLRILWFVMLGISTIGFVSSLLIKDMEMQTDVDENWGLKGESMSPTSKTEEKV